MRLLRALLGATVLLVLNSVAQAQTFTQVQWGINRGLTPSPICVLTGRACLGQIGTLNVGTGAVVFSGSGAALTGIVPSQVGAVNKAGDTMTGSLTAPAFIGSGAGLTNIAASQISTGSFPGTYTFVHPIAMSANAITGLATPVDPSDAATKAYTDSVAQGLIVKPATLIATTANIALTGEQTIDGVLTSASRVLVKNQADQTKNGIYVSAAGAWARSAESSTWAEQAASFTFVQSGTAGASTGWVNTSPVAGTLGVTNITWTQFSAAGSFTAGTGLQLIGSAFSIAPAYIGQNTIEMVGGAAGGVVDNAAVIAGLSPGVYNVCLGNYRISSNINVPTGVVLAICPGSSLAPDVATTTTFRGSINPNVYTKIFTGSGTVTGLAFARPEWWGVTGTADNVPIQKAIASVENSFSSDGDKRQIGLMCKVYHLLAPINLTPTNLINEYFHGCGEQNSGGTVFNAEAGFVGTYLIGVLGLPRGNIGAIADYSIGDFNLFNASGSTTLTGLSFVPSPGNYLEGDKDNYLVNVSINGFQTAYDFRAIRLLHGDRLSAFATGISGATCFRFVPNDASSNVGDMDFSRINCNPNQGGSPTSGLNTSLIFMGSPNGAGPFGISFSGQFYGSNLGIVVSATHGGQVSDMWFGSSAGKMQLDGNCTAFNIQANNSGTSVGQLNAVENIQIKNLYIRQAGITACHSIDLAVTDVGGAVGTARIDAVAIDGNYFANIGNYTLAVSGNVFNSSFSGNKLLYSGHTGSSALGIFSGVTAFTVDGNNCAGSGNVTFTYDNFVLLGSGTDYVNVSPSNQTNGLCGATISNASGGTHNTIGTFH